MLTRRHQEMRKAPQGFSRMQGPLGEESHIAPVASFAIVVDSRQNGSCMPLRRVLAAGRPRLSEPQRHA